MIPETTSNSTVKPTAEETITNTSPDTMNESPLETILGSQGKSLAELSMQSRLLVLFLRHSGCTFCREMLQEASALREELEQQHTQIVVVYQETFQQMQPLLKRFSLGDCDQFSDPDRKLYQAFELQEYSIWNILNPIVWIRGAYLALGKRLGFSKITGNIFQSPGVFVFHQGKILSGRHHTSPADPTRIKDVLDVCPME